MVQPIRTADGHELWTRDEPGTDARIGSPPAHDPVIVPGAVVDADFEPLVEGGGRVVFYDTRNRGRSDSVDDPAQLGFWHEVADLESVREASGLERTAVLGWSYVAGVAARYALLHPRRVTRLVLVNPIALVTGADLGTPRDAAPGALAHLDQLRAAGVDQDDPRRFCEEWRQVYLPLQLADPGAFERVRSRPCDHDNERPSRVTSSLAHVFLDLGMYDWRQDLTALEHPVLVVHGSADEAGRSAAVEWVTTLPDARLLELPGTSRLPWVEDPAAFFGAVDCFLRGEWPATAHR